MLRRRLRAWPGAVRRIQSSLRGWRTRAVLRTLFGQACAHYRMVATKDQLPSRPKAYDWKLSGLHSIWRANEARPLTARAALEQSSVPSFVIQCPQVPKHRSFEIGLPSSRALLAHAGQV